MQNHTNNDPDISTLSLSTIPPLTTFHLFPSLIPELRDQIWALTLPGPRVMQIYWATSFRTTNHAYTTFPNSYGGAHPAILSVNQEARATARRHLTLRFNAYWNLSIDTVYIEKKKIKQGIEQMGFDHLKDLATRGLLDVFMMNPVAED